MLLLVGFRVLTCNCSGFIHQDSCSAGSRCHPGGRAQEGFGAGRSANEGDVLPAKTQEHRSSPSLALDIAFLEMVQLLDERLNDGCLRDGAFDLHRLCHPLRVQESLKPLGVGTPAAGARLGHPGGHQTAQIADGRPLVVVILKDVGMPGAGDGHALVRAASQSRCRPG
jgi:hypothetical protein